MKKYESLNGLRAIAAIGVVLMHVRANIDVEVGGFFIYSNVIARMSDFVFLFMMVSAFSLCCGYYEKFKKGTITPNAFYKRRYARILPFFAVLVLLSIAIPHSPNKAALAKASTSMLGESGFSPFVEKIFEVFFELTLSFGLLPNPNMSVMGVGWFLGVIFLFYMLFPFFIFMMDNKQRAWKSLFIVNVLCFISITYFYSDKFICYNTIPKNIMYDTPFFVMGGAIYLYRNAIEKFVNRYKFLMLVFCVIITVMYWAYAHTKNNYTGVLIIQIVMGSWLIYAIGGQTKVLHNKYIDYLSGISMEVYLCHMMAFRGVEKLHLSSYIHQPDLLYWLTCFLTLAIAIVFSHIVKFKVLPLIEPYLFKQSK